MTRNASTPLDDAAAQQRLRELFAMDDGHRAAPDLAAEIVAGGRRKHGRLIFSAAAAVAVLAVAAAVLYDVPQIFTNSTGEARPTTSVPTGVADPGPTLSQAELSGLHDEGIEPSAVLNDNLSAPWSVAADGQTGKTIDIAYDLGGCNEHLGAQVTEGPGSVEIAIVFRDADLGEDGACPDVGIPVRATVRLDIPLGTRTLLHAPTSPEFLGVQIYGQPRTAHS